MKFFEYQDKQKPVYLQVKNRIRVLILSGGYLTGETLPSVVEMASRLAVNPNNISSAYEALEQDGMLIRNEDGSYNVADSKKVMQSRVDDLLREFDAITEELMSLDATGEMLKDRIQKLNERSKS